MEGEVIGMMIFSGLALWFAFKVLSSLFRAAIRTLKKLGAFAVAVLPAFLAVFLSAMFMDITEAQAATQFVTTDVVIGAIGLKVFGI